MENYKPHWTTSSKKLSPAQRRRVIANTRRAQYTIGRRMRNAMRRFFSGQAQRVVDAWLEADGILSWDQGGDYKSVASQLVGPREDDLIVAASRPYVVELTVSGLNTAAAMTGAEGIVATSPVVLMLADISAQRVVLVNNATRRAIQRAVTRGSSAGYSAFEIANGSTATRKVGFRPLKSIVGPPYLYKRRPDCIARTELAYSNNGAVLHGLAESGFNDVEVADGPGCALTHHAGKRPGETTPEDINGRIITMSQANLYQLAHPNCRRVFLSTVGRRRSGTPKPQPVESFSTPAR